MNVLNKALHFFSLGDEEEETPVRAKEPKKRRYTVVNLHNAGGSEIVVLEPQSFDEVQSIADHLKASQSVVLNLSQLNPDTARRVVDFASGVIYALDGHLQKVSEDIFLFAPHHVDVITRRTETSTFSLGQ